jgi:hypothetical protein
MSAMRAALLQGRPICPSIHRTLEYSEAFARRKGRTRPLVRRYSSHHLRSSAWVALLPLGDMI